MSRSCRNLSFLTALLLLCLPALASAGGATTLAASLLLTGCLPLPLSLAMDDASFATSGKTISDHVLSSFAQRDCSFGRALMENTDICLDEETQELAIIIEKVDGFDNIGLWPASGPDEEGR